MLFPAPLRDLLIRIARRGIVRARWSEAILDEWVRSLLEKRPDLTEAKLARTRRLMGEAVADCLVSGYEPLIDGLVLPDSNDRHVLAAAIHAGVQAIVTFNLKDFPAKRLAPFGIQAVHPDLFVLDALDLRLGAVCAEVEEQARALRNPPRTLAEVLDALQANGLARSVARLRELFG